MNTTLKSQEDKPPFGPKYVRRAATYSADNWKPPSYLVKGWLKHGNIYSVTGMPGIGKSAVGMELSGNVTQGRAFNGRDTKKARVLYFMGENPDDIHERRLVMQEYGLLDPDMFDYIEDVGQPMETYIADIKATGVEYGLVIVDTDMAYYDGPDEGNLARKDWAHQLRQLTTLPGKPAVLVQCHPSASSKDFSPAGGKQFLAQLDGNATLKRKNGAVILEKHETKWRGAYWEPITFEILPLDSQELRTQEGDPISIGRAVEVDIEECLVGPSEKPSRASPKAAMVQAYVRDNPGCRFSDIKKATGINSDTTISKALQNWATKEDGCYSAPVVN